METIEAITKRRTIRNFTSKDVDEELLRNIIKLGAIAPSGRNEQPWQFIMIRDNEVQRKLMLNNSNRGILASAPVVIAVCFDSSVSEYGATDTALAAENIMIGAADQEIGSHVVNSYFHKKEKKNDYEKIKEILKVPNEIDILLLIALGYPAEKPLKRNLRPFEEIIHFDRFGGLRYLKDEK